MLLGASTVAISCVPGLGADVGLKSKSYIRKRIVSLNKLEANVPVYFSYPFDDDSNNNFIVKLEEKAAGGVGESEDIVAFNQYCTHMGAPLQGTYKKIEKVMGACPMHLTTFDLTRHGMVVAGHATESLPQIILEVSDGEIYAVGISGLVYGYSQNPSPSVTPKVLVEPQEIAPKELTSNKLTTELKSVEKPLVNDTHKSQDLIYKKLLRHNSVAFLHFKNTIKLKTKDKMLKHYMLSNPCRIVVDLKSDTSLNTKSYKIDAHPFTKIRIGSHKGYYRVVITLDKEYEYKTTVKDSEILFECY